MARGKTARGRGWAGATRRSVLRAMLALLLASGGAALGHERGWHARIVGTVDGSALELLVVVDGDASAETARLRLAADRDRDGRLSRAEVERLRQRLAERTVEALTVSLGQKDLRLYTLAAKLDLRGDRRAWSGGLSLALLVTAPLGKVPEGVSELALAYSTPGAGHARVEVYPACEGCDPVRGAIQRGENFRVPLGDLPLHRPNASSAESRGLYTVRGFSEAPSTRRSRHKQEGSK